MTGAPAPDDGPSPALIGVISGLLLVLAVALAVLVVSRGANAPGPPDLTATPLPGPTRTAVATPTAPTTPATPAPPTPREPTAADAAAFASEFVPPGARNVDTVAADLDGDRRNEVVVAAVVGGRVRLDIATWSGTDYRVGFTGEGGSAAELSDLSVRDLNGSPRTREVLTRQTVGAVGESVSVWGWDGQEYVPVRAVGGCWDGSHTYGIIGAEVEPERIVATCDGSPGPMALWPSDVYVWDPAAAAFRYERTQ